MIQLESRTCKCGITFTPLKVNQLYHSPQCGDTFRKRQSREVKRSKKCCALAACDEKGKLHRVEVEGVTRLLCAFHYAIVRRQGRLLPDRVAMFDLDEDALPAVPWESPEFQKCAREWDLELERFRDTCDVEASVKSPFRKGYLHVSYEVLRDREAVA